ncbi:pyrroline-5-carboxylate reductase [Achromobacter sp. UMC71]|uniref:pyrroline-5-carboxylate reductase family protein n=1 Tax=Achromobacter sp. UMC71 TaxID=1862320 RepID=UPI0015FFAF48|nr:NAD(P)-binding domain-containing protein [Achromobacter sp. UMC71]MBB1628700.1 hypothetical protein [Achromobacter sp. UMC71]
MTAMKFDQGSAGGDEPLGIIGVGQLAAHIVKGLRRVSPRRPIYLLPRSPGVARQLADQWHCRIAADKAALAAECPTIFLTVKSADAMAALAGLPLERQHLLLSAVATVTLADVARAAGDQAGVVRFMPVISIEVGAGAIPLYPAHTDAAALLATLGRVIPAPDEATFSVMTAAACAHGWFYDMFQVLAEQLQADGVPPAIAYETVLHNIKGAVELSLSLPATAPAALSAAVARPGSYTGMGREYLVGKGVYQSLGKAMSLVAHGLRSRTKT